MTDGAGTSLPAIPAPIAQKPDPDPEQHACREQDPERRRDGRQAVGDDQQHRQGDEDHTAVEARGRDRDHGGGDGTDESGGDDHQAGGPDRDVEVGGDRGQEPDGQELGEDEHEGTECDGEDAEPPTALG